MGCSAYDVHAETSSLNPNIANQLTENLLRAMDRQYLDSRFPDLGLDENPFADAVSATPSGTGKPTESFSEAINELPTDYLIHNTHNNKHEEQPLLTKKEQDTIQQAETEEPAEPSRSPDNESEPFILGDLGPLGPEPPDSRESTDSKTKSEKTPAVGRQVSKLELVSVSEQSPTSTTGSTDSLRDVSMRPSTATETEFGDLEIIVGDPQISSDLTSSFTVYRTTTKVRTTNDEYVVQRRYRDFLWLYDTLHEENPGIIVPPPPQKQAVGRFEETFIEARQNALQVMMNKIAQHPILRQDSSFWLFLKSTSLPSDVKQLQKDKPLPPEARSGGIFGFSFATAQKFYEPDKVMNAILFLGQ